MKKYLLKLLLSIISIIIARILIHYKIGTYESWTLWFVILIWMFIPLKTK